MVDKIGISQQCSRCLFAYKVKNVQFIDRNVFDFDLRCSALNARQI